MKTSVLPLIVDNIEVSTGRLIFICHLYKITYIEIIPETIKPNVVNRGCNIKSFFSLIKTKTKIVKNNLDKRFSIVIYFILSIAWKNQSGNIICPGTRRNVTNITA